jgi:hypothetical protein
MQTIVGQSVCSLRREKEAYKAMSNHNHTGKIWHSLTEGVFIHSEPTNTPETRIGTLHADQQLIVLCYSFGDSISLQHPTGDEPTQPSNAWDFVVTSDQDRGGYVADVFIDTGGDIRQQLGEQGRCDILKRRLADSPGPRG